LEARLDGAILREADLSRAILRKARLRPAAVPDGDDARKPADLTRAKLTGADLTGADLYGAVLVDADLTGACIRHANLAAARLDGVCFDHAELAGAILPAHLPSRPGRAEAQGAANSAISSLKRSAASYCTQWPAPGTTAKRAVG
jgi:uncharacterized protein YjbI with pentapeptide repeats